MKKTTTIKTDNPNKSSDSAKSLVKQEEKQQSKDLSIPTSDKKTKPEAEIKIQPQFEPITSTPQVSKKIVKTDAEWKALLSPEEYQILRQKGTERAFTGKFDKHYKDSKDYLGHGMPDGETCRLDCLAINSATASGVVCLVFYI